MLTDISITVLSAGQTTQADISVIAQERLNVDFGILYKKGYSLLKMLVYVIVM